MNTEGYRDPTAEKAVRNVSRREITRMRLISYCRSRPDDFECGRCEYDAECSAFVKETGHAPNTCDPMELTEKFLGEVIRVKPRRRRT